MPGIYAVGDVASRYLLAHVASAEGVVAAQNCMGGRARMDYSTVPWCVFTIPELARVGMTEEEATNEGYEIKIGRFSLLRQAGKRWACGNQKDLSKLFPTRNPGTYSAYIYLGRTLPTSIHEAVCSNPLGRIRGRSRSHNSRPSDSCGSSYGIG